MSRCPPLRSWILAFILIQVPSVSTWGRWSPCSVTCGKGVQTRSRACDISRNQSDPCDKTQYKICKVQDCRTKVVDYRTLQCQKHNRKPFRGRLYQWTSLINPYAKCGLSCKALYYGFYVQLERSVPNGVTCDSDGKEENICVDGRCLNVSDECC